MLKDIPTPKVENLAIAIVPPVSGATDDLWDVVILNLYDGLVKSVLINTRAYGEIDGEAKRTATMRYFIEEIAPLDVKRVEGMIPELFDLTNEFWVSFSYDGHLYDKKYIFVPGSITPEHFIPIPFIGREGVLIR